MTQRTDFRYVPTSGDISGKNVLNQTERAINDLGDFIDEIEITAAEAVTIAQAALDAFSEALQTANNAFDNANLAIQIANSVRNIFKKRDDPVNIDMLYFEPAMMYLTNAASSELPASASVPFYLSVFTVDSRTNALQAGWSEADPGTVYYRTATITPPASEEYPSTVTWSAWAIHDQKISTPAVNAEPASGNPGLNFPDGLTVTQDENGMLSLPSIIGRKWEFTTSQVWTPPVTGRYRVRIIGGGGPGGSVATGLGLWAGGGGSSGQYKDEVITITKLDPIAITIGRGGISRPAVIGQNSGESSGGTSSVGTYIAAAGGSGGGTYTTTSGVGPYHVGTLQGACLNTSYQIGESASSTHTNEVEIYNIKSGNGGGSPWGAGGYCTGAISYNGAISSNGTNGIGYGSGGSGGAANDAGTGRGGYGAPGYIIIEKVA